MVHHGILLFPLPIDPTERYGTVPRLHPPGGRPDNLARTIRRLGRGDDDRRSTSTRWPAVSKDPRPRRASPPIRPAWRHDGIPVHAHSRAARMRIPRSAHRGTRKVTIPQCRRMDEPSWRDAPESRMARPSCRIVTATFTGWHGARAVTYRTGTPLRPVRQQCRGPGFVCPSDRPSAAWIAGRVEEPAEHDYSAPEASVRPNPRFGPSRTGKERTSVRQESKGHPR